MVSGRITKPDTSILVMALAVAFLLYHAGQYAFWAFDWSEYFGSAPLVHQSPTLPKYASRSAHKLPSVALLGLDADQSLWPTSINIPDVDINLAIEGSIEQSGEWNISETGANFALNTAIPDGRSGNTAIFGHDRPKLFRRLHDLQNGQEIQVNTSFGTYVYVMTGSQVVTPQDISVMDQTETSTLTLLTCDGWLSQNRYVVTAKFSQFIPAE